MRFDGSNPLSSSARRRRAGIALAFLAIALCLAFGAAGAGATGISLDTPLAGVDVNVDENGVGVDVSVPATGTDVQADVGVGDGGVSVDAGVNSPASQPAAGSSGSGSSQSSESGGKQDGGGSGQSASTASNSDRGTTSRGEGGGKSSSSTRNGSRRGDSRSSAPGGALRPSARQASGGLVGLVAASQRPLPAPAAGTDSGNASVVAQLVEYIPGWLWAVIGLLVGALLATAGFGGHQYRRRRAADDVALQDPLTEIANVKAFDERLAQEWARARRHGSGLGVLMIDLDRFKEVNDRRGHATGDRVLIATATALRRHTRESDLVARVGGDEFAVICPETGLRGLKKLRANLEHDIPIEIGFGVGLSIGAAAMRAADQTPSDMVARADTRMYEIKSEHREERDSQASLAHAG